jgi:hypothetical protein
MAHDVFISYSSMDQPAALAVLHGLESAGIRCWIAPRDIGPGAIWAQAIMEGITGCRALVVVFSANANRSVHVLNEVDAAVRKGAVIVPFRIEDVMPDGAMEFHLRTRHWLDALTPDLERHVNGLAEQLTALLNSGLTPREVTLPPRPFPADLPRRPSKTLTTNQPTWWRRVATRLSAKSMTVLLAVLVMGGWWLSRPRAIKGRSLVVREVSSGGGNESTLRLTTAGLRFFEGPVGYASLGQREYATKFESASTRYVKVELPLTYEAPGRFMRIPFSCQLQREGAQILSTLPLTAELQPTWTESSVALGFGAERPGSWEPGRYRVECRYGDNLVARDWFDVTIAEAADDAPMITSSKLVGINARVVRIKLFESGNGPLPIDQRIYTSRFPASGTRYINAEVHLSFPSAESGHQISLNCRYLRDRTEELGRISLRFEIGTGETSRWASAGWGAQAGAYWTPGRYLVACDDGTRTLIQAGFTIY